MNKIILLITALLYSSIVSATAPYGHKGQSQATIYPNVIQVPYSQVTALGGINALIETGNENMFINGGFEGLGTSGVANGWTNGAGTATLTTASGEFSSGKQAQKIVLSTQTLNFSQTVLTPAGIQKQGVVGIIYRLPSAASSGVRICSLVDGSEQKCVDGTNSLITDDAFHSIEIPVVFGATSAGIAIKSIGAFSATVYFDAAYIKQGIGFQNLQGDTAYSANVSAAGAVSNLNKPSWITSCTVASPSVCTLGTGITLTQGMNCVASFSNGIQRGINQSASSTTTISFQEYLPSTNASVTLDSPFNVVCQKTGTDYLAASSSAYVASNANYSRTGYTPTLTGFGTPSNINCNHSRDGEFLDVDCSFTSGTSTATEARVSLPSGLTASGTGLIRPVGVQVRSASTANAFYPLIEPSVTYVTFGLQGVANAGLTKQNGDGIVSSGQTLSFTARIPISGWTNAAQIVGSFAGYGRAPGLDVSATPNLDTFSVSYGTTNATTVCSASPCSYLDQIGTAVTSITRASTGNYTLNFAKTYTKVKCVAPLLNCAGSNYCGGVSLGCTGSTCSFPTYTTGVAASADTNGTIMCQGSY